MKLTLEEIGKLLGVDDDAYLKASEERNEKLRAAGSPWVDCPRKTPTGAFNIPTLDESLYWEYVAGIITLEDAAREFCKDGWDNFVNCHAALYRFTRIDENYHKL